MATSYRHNNANTLNTITESDYFCGTSTTAIATTTYDVLAIK